MAKIEISDFRDFLENDQPDNGYFRERFSKAYVEWFF